MTGQEEIENMARQVRTIAKEYQDRPRLEVRIEQNTSWVPGFPYKKFVVKF